nr:hypothetical protein GCM10025699_60090 [Microbacterium flavescens]
MRADAAAEGLARLAEAGVAGASPDDWYGLPAATSTEPLADLTDPETRVPVSPSQLGSFEECPLHWFVDRFGGSAPNAAMGLGTVLHDVMEHAVDSDVESLWAGVEARWGELRFESAWIAESEKRRARAMTESLAAYLRDFEAGGGALIGAESTFQLDIGPARLRGAIDRVERTRDGAAVIVDLKTGRSAPTSAAAVAEHPQLGSYQVALADGAIEAVPPGTPPGEPSSSSSPRACGAASTASRPRRPSTPTPCSGSGIASRRPPAAWPTGCSWRDSTTTAPDATAARAGSTSSGR